MTIDFFEGSITADQVRVPDHMRYELMEGLPEGGVCLVDESCFWMDREGLMWLDGKAPRLLPADLDEDDEKVWVVRLPEGFVVDISEARDCFVDDRDGVVKFAPAEHPPYAADGDSYVAVPIVGLITNELEASFFRAVLAERHGIMYPGSEDAPVAE
ncbi:MAG TPA: hypothetical protein VM124_03150 [Candidatus Limnocylindrales bacterium]|nr:hypothetical protein [Candidatus Limnocylindrales bacterium]